MGGHGRPGAECVRYRPQTLADDHTAPLSHDNHPGCACHRATTGKDQQRA